ncbi:hypothetical protein CAI21_06925 [Alkalilimnicola ehrlichii]|uniref:DNA gyrase inhibitor YacG n=1 Tax=Alkalilimnicola ehrlichii TaxID=351052 RepID=A0A3E0X157_9GAMM|nr:DNA gyrase inhibitor YacG [Alkalilimnicola ehrlichii]RFA30333.1 hypothetical protein CAI21_06925 [Alkalilimnicola ehrlichii]RFA37907.1 hypothetical protein CAL65_08270 [Alkalilimnicola ehrlichii]
MTVVRCPTCDTKVVWNSEARYRPFCSRRCKLIDLGAWFDGSNHIAGNELNEPLFDNIDSDYPSANE